MQSEVKEDNRGGFDWSDVVPIPQDDGPNPVAAIDYSNEYRSAMDLFRAIAKNGEHSERSLWLTSELIRICPANYGVWAYRRDILEELSSHIASDFSIMDGLDSDDLKNYQLWFHRQWLVQKTGITNNELEFTKNAIEGDNKHYHAWSYRQWFLNWFGGWEGELNFTLVLLIKDPMNNSAWNQRWQAIAHINHDKSKDEHVEQQKQEEEGEEEIQQHSDQIRAKGRTGLLLDIDIVKAELALSCAVIDLEAAKSVEDINKIIEGFTYQQQLIQSPLIKSTTNSSTTEDMSQPGFSSILVSHKNEAAWNYLRGFFTLCGAGYKYADFPFIARFAEEVALRDVRCADAVGILIDACEELGTENSVEEAKEV
ncbi:MAG: putative Protein farnesyltransferase/geranylgeranyltransferase type-1 subunit alpha [Streblomastix strix]|uniref:Protein farnesyltransferase/geranylgeranyltransferase type-1 subunit alpha n=1 Tax=Streblomastix strix TaxID=222440 RepID=A0A5J4UN73_9EUKA|nr:MAG: putative Protein farnesyltransferase/geranylgeranyltransferase type-1 subunit alpha [Streblomastix strix]